jgi:hypothetical protein
VHLTKVPLLAASLALLGLFACSRSQRDSGAQSHSAASASSGDLFKHFDPTSLVEVQKFSELPEALKATIRVGWVLPTDREAAIESPGGYRIFAAGGASNSNALVAYEVGDFVPMHEVVAYVHVDSKWIVARRWSDIGPTKSLSQLRYTIDYLSSHVSDQQEGGK